MIPASGGDRSRTGGKSSSAIELGSRGELTSTFFEFLGSGADPTANFVVHRLGLSLGSSLGGEGRAITQSFLRR